MKNVCVRLAAAFAYMAVIAIAPPSFSQTVYPGFYREGVITELDWKGIAGAIDMGSGHGLEKGAQLIAVRLSISSTDPATGKVIPPKETVVGMVEVTEVTGSSSSAIKVTKGVGSVVKGDAVRRRVSHPNGLAATATGFRKINVEWEAGPEPEIREYWIYRATSPEGPYKIMGKRKSSDKLEFLDKHSSGEPMADSTLYYYKVTAVNTLNNESEPSPVVECYTQGPPPPPVGLSGEEGKIRSIPLSWNEHSNGEVDGYRLYRSKFPQGPFTMIKEIRRRTETKYHDFGDGSSSSPKLDDSTTYYYAISALSPFGDEGMKSVPVSVATASPPAIPARFAAQSWRPRKVPLSWETSPDENVKGYLLYRSKEEQGPYAQIAEINDRKKTEYVDGERSGIFSTSDDLKDFTLYYYKIQAYNWAGSRSEMSEPISATTKPAPMAPEDVKTTSNRPLQVPITWRLSPEADLKEYRVFRSDSEIGEFKKIGEVPADKNYYLDDKLESDRKYFYKLQVVDKYGLEGEFSKVVSATTKKRPSPVHGLRWERESSKVVLKWDPNSEIDIIEYIVYKKGFFGWQKAGSTKENFYILEGFKQGDKDDFAVSAMDVDKLEGDKSGVLTVDLR